MLSTLKKGAYADLTDLYKKEGKELYEALDPAYIKGNTVNGKIYSVPVAANVASSQNFAFNGPLLEKIWYRHLKRKRLCFS